MIVITVLGITEGTEGLIEFEQQLRKSVTAFLAFGLTPDDVFVSCPADLLQAKLRKALILRVEGFPTNAKASRTERDGWLVSLLSLLERFAKAHVPTCKLVKVLSPSVSDTTQVMEVVL